ncbi:hypothetical protein [Agromyces allii]|nr:hypothetical protein [Agromyces allii]
MELPRLPNGLIRFADVREAGLQRTLAADLAARRIVRVRRGVYVDAPPLGTPEWRRDELRHTHLVSAAAESMRAPVFTGFSALALLGLPSFGRWPRDVCVLADGPTGHRRPGVVAVAAPRPPDVERVQGGMFVTSVEFALVQACRVGTLAAALAAVDAALWVPSGAGRAPLTTIERLLGEHERLMPYPGSRRTEAVLVRATSRSQTVLETVSRLVIEECGFQAPVLQESFRLDELAMTADVDFWWPSVRAIGEADGRGKYLAGATAHGSAVPAGESLVSAIAARAVIREKDRENALRRRVTSMDRWDWTDMVRKDPLEQRLLAMGVPRTRQRRALVGSPEASVLRSDRA